MKKPLTECDMVRLDMDW